MFVCVALPLEDLIDELPTTIRRRCPVNQCIMRTGPLGAVYRGASDVVLHWICPVCGAGWHRWHPGHPLREQAEFYLKTKAWTE